MAGVFSYRALADRPMVEAIREIKLFGLSVEAYDPPSDNRAIYSCASFSSVQAVASRRKSTLV